MVNPDKDRGGLYVELSLPGAERARLRELFPGPVWFAEPGTTSESDARALAEAGTALGNPRADRVANAPRLKWLQLASVGIDDYLGLDWPVLGRRLTVTNLGDVFADPVAQSCLAGILTLHRGIDLLSGLRAEGSWAKSAVRPRLRLLTGARVLVLGRGSIARRFAELLGPFGCPVTHFARGSGDIRTLAGLDERLPGFDVVVGLLPGTPETSGLLDARRLALLRPGAVLVNAGRGSLVDEEALVSGLTSGRLGGAVLDVTGEEPLPAGHPLWTCPGVVLTQHTAGGSTDESARVVDLFADNWRRFHAGSPLRNPVQWSRGF
ncbi:D-2-hydroxyacid dehydrogenase [Streptomyces sp. NBC_00378]|uniref:D-2-hydroxyacid dehydrogenase n=1 Tax=unclassified Streptomyces TaxID=2593676 RepID=UPI0022589BA3|nr:MULTISPECIES: D-2-hydroxyacid dehydrogenase [unclassified Streptomyces]MCX5112959.1 D-2-hydroxyacid dehydrogenase [Streptomyces sp. NBC_00378]